MNDATRVDRQMNRWTEKNRQTDRALKRQNGGHNIGLNLSFHNETMKINTYQMTIVIFLDQSSLNIQIFWSKE